MKLISNDISNKKAPVSITIILSLLVLGSIVSIIFPFHSKGGYIADIYQNGVLIQSIPLYNQTETYHFEIVGENGCINLVEVKPGSIGIVSADCPDKLCVGQGHIHNSLLPITCLPNRLVIQLRAIEVGANTLGDSITPDIVTH